MSETAVTIDALRRFDASERRGRPTSALGHVGLQLDDDAGLEFLRGDETPANAVVFAHTGGDGVHFCALETAGAPDGERPVVMVVPAAFGETRLVVGGSLREFLAVGLAGGYLHLDQLLYDRSRAFDFLFDREAYVRWCYPSPEARREYAQEIAESGAVLDRLAAAFGLAPWPSPAGRLAQLQAACGPLIRIEGADG
jgi:hypothetical protein